MSQVGEAALLAVFVLATSIWVGGYVAIVVVARAATATLDDATRVAFFRSLGRSYLWVGFPALLIALAAGGVLARGVVKDGTYLAVVASAAVLLISFAVAVAQARRMTRLRRGLLRSPDDAALRARVGRGARAAGGLRAVLGLLTLVLVVLGAFVAV